MRKPSPAMIVALLGVFLGLGGVGVAATGGNFILGQPNTAGNTTGLSAGVGGGKALQVTNTNTTSGSTALGLSVNSGHAPFTVNSPTKVANLNADKLDGIDSSALQRRVSGTCASGSAIRAVASSGSVSCQNTQTQYVFQGTVAGDTLPTSHQMTTHGGLVLMFLSGSGFRTAAQGAGFIGITASIDGGGGPYAYTYANETLSHKATVPAVVLLEMKAGTHTLNLALNNGASDGNDHWRVSAVEFPH